MDVLTVAFVGMGIEEALRRESANPDLGGFEGMIGFVDVATRYVEKLDLIADWFDEHSSHAGVFLYDVANLFGYEFAKALLLNPEADANETARSLFIKADYQPEEIDAAFLAADEVLRTR